jgi:gamma-glutamyltranspeptidase / glutathione hydrolase
MSLDGLTAVVSTGDTMGGLRPSLLGTRHMVSAGHYLAAHAAFEILEGGGNAVDAGVAACIVMAVVQSDFVNVAGVAPMMFYSAEKGTVESVAGLGFWPAKASAEYFLLKHNGEIPEGILRTVVPAAPAAWITALRRYGTVSFADVSEAAIRFARDGFVMYPLMAEMIVSSVEKYRRWPSSAAIYLPNGGPPKVGEIFVQKDLAATLQYLVDEEAAHLSSGRDDALRSVHDAFYSGDVARTICHYHSENGGLLAMDDMQAFAAEIEPAVSIDFAGTEVFSCNTWCQGPVLLQTLRLLDDGALDGLEHNSPAYIHRLCESIKLAFADRHAYYGDPRFCKVPLEALLSKKYAAYRRDLIDSGRAQPHMPLPGDVAHTGVAPYIPHDVGAKGLQLSSLDTSYVCVVDRFGNAFSATPSDISGDTPVIPGTGLCVSSRGSQSWTDPDHPAAVAPRKRPRLTPTPGMAIRPGKFIQPFGTPGGDVQCQAMLQTFLNRTAFGMNPQQSVEAPRFASYSFPDSFWPHNYFPGRLNLEDRISEETGKELSRMGHDVARWPAWTWKAGGMCMIVGDLETGVLEAGADPRRPSYAVGW